MWPQTSKVLEGAAHGSRRRFFPEAGVKKVRKWGGLKRREFTVSELEARSWKSSCRRAWVPRPSVSGAPGVLPALWPHGFGLCLPHSPPPSGKGPHPEIQAGLYLSQVRRDPVCESGHITKCGWRLSLSGEGRGRKCRLQEEFRRERLLTDRFPEVGGESGQPQAGRCGWVTRGQDCSP